MHADEIAAVLDERESIITREYASALESAGFPPGATVLDVATGSGRMLEQLLLKNYSVISGDIDPEALNRTRERLGNLADKAALVILNAGAMEFGDNSFGAVTLANAVHEMDDPHTALGEIVRVLKPDGRLLLVEFNSLGYEVMELHHKLEGKGAHSRGRMNNEEIDSCLHSAFSIVQTQDFKITRAWIASGKKQR